MDFVIAVGSEIFKSTCCRLLWPSVFLSVPKTNWLFFIWHLYLGIVRLPSEINNIARPECS